MSLLQLDPNKHYIRMSFVQEADIVSDLILPVERGEEATHVDHITRQGTKIGARAKGGVQERPEDYLKHIRWERRYALEVTHLELVDAIDADARAACGKIGYDFLDIFGLALQIDLFTKKGKMICSEFEFLLLANRFKQLLNVTKDKAYKVTPELLHLCPYLIGKCYYEVGA